MSCFDPDQARLIIRTLTRRKLTCKSTIKRPERHYIALKSVHNSKFVWGRTKNKENGGKKEKQKKKKRRKIWCKIMERHKKKKKKRKTKPSRLDERDEVRESITTLCCPFPIAMDSERVR